MKTHKNLFVKCLDKDTIRIAINEAAKGKRKRKDVKKVLDDIDGYVELIHSLLSNKTYIAHVPRETEVHEGTKNKTRVIRKVRFFDQIIHHIIILVLKDFFMKGMYGLSCGSVPNRGIHYGKRFVERWVRTDFKNTKYCAQMDIRHYFESVDHDKLKAQIAKHIKDDEMLWLIGVVIDSCPVGIPLGYYTSQWFANYFLQGIDHYIKEQLHVKYYVRYLDDMVIFGRNKKEVHKARAAIAAYLETLGLEMKNNWQVFRTVYTDKQGKERGRALDFMGFRFYQNKTVLRKSLMLRITRKVSRVARKSRPTYHDAASILSYMGWITNSDTYEMYHNRIKDKINVKRLKHVVSVYAKNKEREVKNNAKRLEGDRGNAGAAPRRNRQNKQPDNRICT